MENSTEKDVEQQQVPSSSTESTESTESIESTDQRSDAEQLHRNASINGTNDSSTIALTTIAANTTTSSESVPTNTNESSSNDDDANDLASSSRLVEIESDCRTETKLNNKLDKREIISELTTASIANCDSSEILDDSMNVNHSNGSSNNVSDSRGDNVDGTTIEAKVSCENGAKIGADDATGKSDEEMNNFPSDNCPMPRNSSPVACAIDSSSLVDSTEKHSNENDDKRREEPTSSEQIHSQCDNTPSVHSNVSDKGGGTETQLPAQQIVLNESVDSINSSAEVNIRRSTEKPLDESSSSKIEICSTSRMDDKIGCDPKHSSVVEPHVAYGGSVIRPTNLIVSNIKQNPRDEMTSTSTHADCFVRSDSLPHNELPKSSMDVKATESKYVKASVNASSDKAPNNLSLDLTQSHPLSGRPHSLYVSNPDFSRPKPSTEDLSSLRMKPPDFSKLTHAYPSNNLKIPNPNFNEIDAPLKQHQPSVNPANFAEISKRLNYISDLQLKTTTPATTHTTSYDRGSLDANRSLSNLYVKAPDFSKKKTSHDVLDEPTAHVIHKNPYPSPADKSHKSAAVPPPSDPAIIYRNYPQISQDVTMSIVQTHGGAFPQPQQPPQPQHQQPLSQKQNMVEQPQPVDQRYKQSYPNEIHKGHPGMYRSPVPSAHHLYENRMSDASYTSQAKPMNISYKHKAEPVSGVHPYQRDGSRAAVIQSGKPSESDAYSQKLQSNYVQPGYYEKPIAKPVVGPMDYMQQHFNNARYPTEYNDRIPPNKSNFERPGYCEPMPGLYQDHYKQMPSMKSSPINAPMAAPSSRPLRSPVMHSKPIEIPSGGHMNPPQYWPSHSPRITQSPISLSSSPLSGRVTQSPAGASPSPQHIMHTPSALPAQSPTYRYASPHQPQTSSPYNVPTTASSPIQFKDAVNPAMFQKPAKSKASKPTKASASQPSSTPNYYYLPPESTPYAGHQYSMKVEQSAHYPPQYSAKTDNNLREDIRTKPTKSKSFSDYVDLTKTSKPSEMPPNLVGQENRYDQRSYLNERHELHHRPEPVKHVPEPNRTMDKHVYNSQQKTIMDPYAYRKASEADLNYEIIKKTLNKDISIRRSDADLSCSIFDTPKANQSKNVPYPPSNEYYGRGTGSSYPPNFNYHPQPAETSARRDAKGVPLPDRYYAGHAQPVAKNHDAEQASRAKTYSVENNARPSPNDLKKHDLSVTVSRISAAIAQPVVERARLQHSETTIPITHQPARLQATKTHISQPTVPQKPSSTVKSVLHPVKRESPLDLSVKTVKTKADSTGDDYVMMPSSSRDYTTPLSLKVDFAPNFHKHARVPDKSSSSHIPPRYDTQMTNSQYPPVNRPASHPVSQNVPQRSADKLPDARYHQPHHSSTSHGASTYAQSQVLVTASLHNRSHPMASDPFKHQSKPLVLSPTVPTVFGRKPEELKNLPINPELQDFRSKSQTTKSNYHSKQPSELYKSQEIPVKFADFKTKNVQNSTIPSLVESSRPPYGYPTGERLQQYQEQRPTLIPSQANRLVEPMPAGHFDPYYSRKRPAEPPSHDQYPKVKVRRDEPPSQQHYYNMDKRYASAADAKPHDRYEMPAERMDYHPKLMAPNYQREIVEPKFSSVERLPTVEPRDNINPVVRENIPPNYAKQHPFHYAEPMYNQTDNKAVSHPPTMSYPSEQHQKHLAYQKSKKEAYKQLPSSSPPSQQHFYPRDSKHPYDSYNTDSYQPYKTEAKPYYNEPGYVPSPYPKQDANPLQQVYQQPWPQNQPTLPPDSSKQPYYPTPDVRNYRELNQIAPPPQSSIDTAARPNHRPIPTDSSTSSARQQNTTLKGADQTVISKLRTNLEMKEIEKQKLLRTQSSIETMDDDNQKSDIASLIAARIRTKGELKGFTPIPVAVVAEPKPDLPMRCDDDGKKELPAPIRDLASDGDNASAFDLLDWGSACNDFVEQLQGAGSKKRGRRRRGKSSLIDAEFETVGQEVPLQNLPGVDYKCDIDESVVSIVKAENKSVQDDAVNPSTKNDDSSSDEDKPLLFLRQKSLNELGKLKAAQEDDAVNESSTSSTKQSSTDKRTTVLAKLSEKIAKNKKGQQREKRENEKRISIASSSESDDDVASKVKRPKKTVRKPRTRSSVGYKNTSDDETSENGSKNSKRKNDHTKRKKSAKSSSDSEPLKQRKKTAKNESDDKSDSEDDEDVVKLVTIKQEVITDDDESDCKIDVMKTPVKKEPGVVSVKIEETMTRSKRKQELERQKANSKILRNEKMVKNVSIVDRKSCEPKKGTEKNSPKAKCKSGCKDDAKKKSDDAENGESSKNDSAKKKGFRVASIQSISSDSEENEAVVSLRRRTRSAKSMDQRTPEKSKNATEKVVEKRWSRTTPQKKAAKEPNSKPSAEQYPPGWENEVYEFKRSLKIPASLITIKRPAWYRKSISLPDLDPHSSDTSETFSEKKQLFLKPFSELSDRKVVKKDIKQSRPANSTVTVEKVCVEAPEKRPDDLRSKSIIDMLHQKIIHPISRNSKKARLLHSNEPKLLPQSTEIELLSTPGAEDVFKHQSVFDTAVLKSRTRKEYRVQKNQEIIREVFGCDDRPASAPPLHANVDNKAPVITFDQKYKQYLEKMNADFGDSKPNSAVQIVPDVSIVKQEKIDDDSLLNDEETQDTEINECERNALDIKDEPLDSNERDTPSVSEREGITPSSFSLIRKRGRGARGGRRKGSSGI